MGVPEGLDSPVTRRTTSPGTMEASADLYDFLRWWEGLPGGLPALDAYRDGAGVLTIGYGHTLGVQEGARITEAEAEGLLQFDVQEFVDGVNRLVAVPLEQHQFDALVSFSYNVGLDEDEDTKAEGLGDSSLLRLVNAAQFGLAAGQFTLWVYSNGQVSRGLERRRIAEQAMFRFGDYGMRP